MKRTAPEQEPEESNFKLPPEAEYLLQITDVNPVSTPSGHEENLYRVHLEIVSGEEKGTTLLHRVNTDDSEKAFYYCRLFLKAIGEPYKGEFDIDVDNWVGKQFYATIKHNGKYANIDEYNFEKKIENQYKKPVGEVKSEETEW